MHRPDEDVEVYLHRVTCFVWMINSWSVCDTFKFAGGQRLWTVMPDVCGNI